MADVVTSTFTANTSQLESALKTILDQQTALEGSTLKSGAALDKFSASGEHAAGGVNTATVASEGLNGVLEQLTAHTELASGVLEKMGVEAGGAAKGLAFLTEAAAGLEGTIGPLLAVGAAIAVIAAAAATLHEGIGEAADLQSQMETLGAVVKSQGGDWAGAQDGLNKFVESESLATGFTAGQLVPALNQLVTAGNDVHDSLIIMSVATELARAKHMEISQAVELIIGMEAGRSRGLVAQDLNLRKLVGTNATLSDWLGVLHKDYGNAITDSNSLEMQQARLGAAWSQVSETLGKIFLPLLTEFAVRMIGALENAKDLASGLYQMFDGAITAAKAAGAAIGHFAVGLGDLANHNFGGAADEFRKVGDAGKAAWAGITVEMQGYNKVQNELLNGQDGYVRGHKIINDATYAHNQKANQLGHLDNNRVVKATKPAKAKKPKSESTKSAGTFTTQDVDKYIERLTVAKDAQAALSQSLLDLDARLDGDRAAVSSATTVHDLAAAKLKLEKDTADELAIKRDLLTAAINKEKSATGSLAQAHQDAIEHQHNLADAIHQYNLEIAASNGGTIAQQNTLAELKQAEKEAQKELVATGAAITANTNNLKTNTAALDANNKKIAEQKNALADVQLKYDEYLTKETQKNDEAKATLGMTTAQLYSFYAQQYQKDFALWKSYVDAKNTYMAGGVLPQLEADQTRANQEQIKLYDENQKAHQAMLAKMTSNVTTFLDDVIVKHKSFKDILTGIYDQILAAFISMVAKMIVESALFGKIFGNLGAGGSSGGDGLLSGLLGAVTGGGGASGKAEVVLSDVGPNAAKVLTGSTNGISGLFTSSSGAATGMGIFAVLAGAAGLGGLVGGAVGGPGAPNAKQNGAIGAMLGAGGVMAYAAMAPGLLGGAAGLGGIGALLTGPAGIGLLLGGALLGGALGGMIGPHWGPASNYPDRGPDAAAYQNFLSTFNSGPGGGGDQLEKLVASEDPSKLTGQALTDYLQLKALEAGTGQLGISNEHDGVFTLHAGTTDKVDDFEALVARFNAETAPGAAGATSPIYALSRMAPDFNTARMSQWASNTTIGSSVTAPAGGGPLVTPPQINITVNGVIGDKSQVAQVITQQIQRNAYYRFGNHQLQ